jgi:itaconate CoA-transferase
MINSCRVPPVVALQSEEIVSAPLPPGRNSSFDYRMDAVPAVGQHTDAILRELGLSDAQVAALRAAQAI